MRDTSTSPEQTQAASKPEQEAAKKSNIFSTHPAWWAILVVSASGVSFVFPPEAASGDLAWAATAGSVIGLLLGSFFLAGLAWLLSGRKMTTVQFMCVYSVAMAILVASRITVTVHQKAAERNEELMAQQEADRRTREEQEAITKLEVFDGQLELKNSGVEDIYYATALKGRIKNLSSKTLYSIYLKVSVFSSEKQMLDTKEAKIFHLSVAPGDTQAFREELYIDRLPKGFTWQWTITSASFE